MTVPKKRSPRKNAKVAVRSTTRCEMRLPPAPNRAKRLSPVPVLPPTGIIAAALNQAELDDATERGAGARIEFKPEGHAKVTITISRELVDQARALDLTTGELFAEARSGWPSLA